MHAYQRKTEKFLISKEKSFIGSATVKKLFCYQFISPQLEGLEIDLFALEFCFFSGIHLFPKVFIFYRPHCYVKIFRICTPDKPSKLTFGGLKLKRCLIVSQVSILFSSVVVVDVDVVTWAHSFFAKKMFFLNV